MLKCDKEKKIAKNIKHDTKAFFQYISSKMLKKEGVGDLDKGNGELATNDKEKCDVITNFFSTVFSVEDHNNVPTFNFTGAIPQPLLTCTASIDDFEKVLSTLNPNKSPGPDGLHPKFLKNTYKSLARPLKFLFDLTFIEGNLPTDFKLAEVRPIYKIYKKRR